MAESPTMEVRARLSAETAQFTRGMAQATQSVQQLQSSAGTLHKSMVAIGAVTGIAGAALIAFAKRAFDAASRVEELDIALQAVGHSTGIGYQALNDAALAIKANGIEMEIAQKSALKFAQNNLELAKAQEVARVAQDLAVIGAMNSSDAFDRLTHGIITGRSEVLKSVGIQKSAGQAYAEFAATLGKTAKELTYTEKQTAIMNMVIAEGARVAGTYEASMMTAGKVLRSYARLHNELGVAVGGVLLKAFGPLIFQTYETYKAFIKAITSTGAFKDILTALQMVLVKITTPVTNFVMGLKDKITALNQAKINIVALANQMEILIPIVTAAGSAIAAFAGKNLLNNLPIIGNFFSRLRVLPIALFALFLSSNQVRQGLANLFTALKPLIDPILQLGKAIGSVLGVAVAAVGYGLNAFAQYLKNNEQIAKTLGIAISALGAAFLAYRGYLLITTVATNALEFAQRLLNKTMMMNPIGLIIGAIAALATGLYLLYKNSEEFRKGFNAVFDSVGKVVAKVLAFIIDGFGKYLLALGYVMENLGFLGEAFDAVFNFIFDIWKAVYTSLIKGVQFVLDAFINLMEGNEKLRAVTEAVFNTILRIIIFSVTNIVTTLANIIKGVASVVYVFEQMFDRIKPVLTATVKANFEFAKAVVGYFGKMAKGISDFLVSSINNIYSFVQGTLGALSKLPGIGKAFEGLSNTLESLKRKTVSSFDAISSAAENFFGIAENGSADGVSSITVVNKKLIESSKSWGNYTSGVAGSLSNIANKMLDFSQEVVEFGAKNNGKAIVDGLLAGAKAGSSAISKIIETASKIGNLEIGKFIFETGSKAATQAGNFLIGLAAGIESLTKGSLIENLGNAMSDMANQFKEVLGFGNVLEEERKKLLEFDTQPGGKDNEAVKGILENSDLMKRIREAMADGLQSMRDVLQDLKDAAADFAKSLKDTIVGFAGLKGVELPEGFIPQAKSLIENMRMRLEKSRQFSQQIASLQAMGLDAGALKDIIEMGPIKGAQIAASILGGGMAAVQEISELQKLISFTGASIGAYGREAAYGDLIRSAQTAVSGLTQAEMDISARGSQVVIEQGAFVVNVNTAGLATDEERADLITRRIQETFAILAKELAAK